jgi:HAD superfamily hydrolase (TIGR01509 family)
MIAAAATLRADAVVADCDGTLVATETLWGLAERAVCERHGGAWSMDLKRRLVGRSIAESAAAIAAWCGVSAFAVSAAELHEAYALVQAREPVAAKPGAAALLDDLAARGIPVAVASNSTADEVRAALGGAGLLDRVVSIHTPGGGLAPKPAPDVFLAACRALGVEPARAVALEDSQAGLDAATAAGLTTVGVPSLPGQDLSAAHVVASLADVAISPTTP